MSDNAATNSRQLDFTGQHPELEALAAELAVVIQHGLRESALLTAVERLPTLLGLACVATTAGGLDGAYDRLKGLRNVLRTVISRMDDASRPDFRLGLDRLFGATDALSTLSPDERRELASKPLLGRKILGKSFARRHEETFRQLVADRLLDYEREVRARQTHHRMRLGEPADPSITIDWLDRFQYYYRIWASIAAVRDDFDAYLTRRALDRGDPALRSYFESSLWFFACLQLDVARFIDERGGLWLLSDADVEQEVSRSLSLILWHPPTSTLDGAWLADHALTRGRRQMLRFHRALEVDPRGRAIFRRWGGWLERCHCGPQPETGCEVHQVMAHAERYMDLIEHEWHEIASWYKQPPKRPQTKSLRMGDLFRQFEYRLQDS